MFTFNHFNFNVLDLARSVQFYHDALGLDAAHAKHAAMGCICFENPGMGIYFIEDPDGYWIEIVPEK